jgi:hypothetical protein
MRKWKNYRCAVVTGDLKRNLPTLPILFLIAGCGSRGSGLEDVSRTQEPLNGQAFGPLTRLTYSESNEANRELDTQAYYQQVQIGPDGNSGGTIASALGTLTNFKNHYGFVGHDHKTYYYNRGDLGIGREMHCVDDVQSTGEIACYVKNFAAGDDGSVFTFGLSSNIAFSNLDNGHAFATVAMAYRDKMPKGSKDRVLFAVYDGKTETLLNAANLDRLAQDRVGVPGVDFNAHIPSNCVACHGGKTYGFDFAGNAAPHSQTGGLFLPFDLDQFDYESTPTKTRNDQEPEFKYQNEMVRKVAALTRNIDGYGASVVQQLDGWYNNTQDTTRVPPETDYNEVFENAFQSSFVPSGWSSAANIYQSVVRPVCRTCHLTNEVPRPFDTEAQFDGQAQQIANDLCSPLYAMPHSLQALRQFWFSAGPTQLVSYFNSVPPSQCSGCAAAAAKLQGCGPGAVVTLDPPQVQAVLAGLL